MEETSSYQKLLDKAREISRARYAALVKLDTKTLNARVAYFSGTNTQAFLKGTSAIRKIAPNFKILNVSFSTEANKLTRAVYIQGLIVQAGVQEISENVIDKRVLWLAQQIGGLRYGLIIPFTVDGLIGGAISLYSPKPFSDSQRSAADSFVKHAHVTIEKLSRAEELSLNIREMERSRDRLISSDPLLRMVSHQFSQPMVYDGITIDPRWQSVTFKGVRMNVMPREYYVLACLISRANSAVSTEILAMQVWGYPESAGNRFVDATVTKLKKNLDAVGCTDMIHEIKSYGYILQKRNR